MSVIHASHAQHLKAGVAGDAGEAGEAGGGVSCRGLREDVSDHASVADAGPEPGERHRICGCGDAVRWGCSGQGCCRFGVSQRGRVGWGGFVGYLTRVVSVELNENLSPPEGERGFAA